MCSSDLLRALGGKGAGFYRDTRVPIIGRISMDLITLDLTRALQATPGDYIDFIGPHQSVDDVAAAAGTNGYEVLCRLGGRFHRVYRDEGGVP